MTQVTDMSMPGDAVVVRAKHIPFWQSWLLSLAFMVSAIALFFMPAGTIVRVPWVVAVTMDALGPIGTLFMLLLLSIGFFIVGMRSLLRR